MAGERIWRDKRTDIMPSERKWVDIAEDILEKILAKADAARSDESDSSYPYKIIRREIPPEFANIERILPNRVKLAYRLSAEDWEDFDEDGTFLAGQYWEADLQLSTDGIPQTIYRNCEGTLEKFLSTSIVTDSEGNKKSLLDALSPDIRTSLLEAYVEDAIETFFYDVKEKLELALIEHSRESHFLASVRSRARAAEMAEAAGVELVYDPNEYHEEMKQLLAEFTAFRRRFLKADIYYSFEVPEYEKLGTLYKKVLPVWKGAKLIYRQNSSRATWRDIIRAAYPDVEFDDDLLSRLSGKLNDLSEEIQANLSEKGGDSKPSSIALEHAARLCGVQPYQYSLRHLYNIKNKMERRDAFDDEDDSSDDEESSD